MFITLMVSYISLAAGRGVDLCGGRGRGGGALELAPGAPLVGDDERALGPREGRDVLGRAFQQPRADRDVVGAAGDRNGHPDQRRSSCRMRSATSSGVPVPSTTWAANSRYRS